MIKASEANKFYFENSYIQIAPWNYRGALEDILDDIDGEIERACKLGYGDIIYEIEEMPNCRSIPDYNSPDFIEFVAAIIKKLEYFGYMVEYKEDSGLHISWKIIKTAWSEVSDILFGGAKNE